jgi:hypothetical protein
LVQVSDAGGNPQPLTRLEKGEENHRFAEVLPGGKAVLFSTAGTSPGISVQAIGTDQKRNLIPGGRSAQYASSGHLIYMQGGTLTAVPFDLGRLQVTGSAVPVVDGVQQTSISGGDQYSVSGRGSLAYVSGGAQATQQLVWVTRNGTEQALAAPPRLYVGPRLSPDSHRLVVVIQDQGENQLWLYDLVREALSRFTFGGNWNSEPAWTPDGKHIAFVSTKEGPRNLFWQTADGSGGLERLTTSENTSQNASFSGDGQFLAYQVVDPPTGSDIWVLNMKDRKAQSFLHTPAYETTPRFSPDGRWLAYVSDEAGRYEVYVQPYPGPGEKYQISTDGGTEPVWNRNGRELFYRSGEKMMAVDVTGQGSFSVGKPRVLFSGPYVLSTGSASNYDVSADGQRFLMIKPNEQTTSASLTQIVVVQNFFEELKRRVPTGTILRRRCPAGEWPGEHRSISTRPYRPSAG